MTKSELKNGAVLKTRNGDVFVKVDNILLDIKMDGTFMDLLSYDEDLTCIDDESYDIVSVDNKIGFYCDYCNLAIYNYYYKNTNHIIPINKNILDKIERKYLNNIIKPFKKEVINIYKRQVSNEFYCIIISTNSNNITLPYFPISSDMYKNMKENKNYSLEDLKLDD